MGLGKKDYKAIYVVNTEVVNYPNPESKYSLTCPTPKKLSGYKVQVTSTQSENEGLKGKIDLFGLKIKNLELRDNTETVSVSIWTDKLGEQSFVKVLEEKLVTIGDIVQINQTFACESDAIVEIKTS